MSVESQDLQVPKYPVPTRTPDIIFSQPTSHLRWIEATTDGRHLESLFLLIDDARDAHIRQLLSVFPTLTDKSRVVRFANVKLNQHDPEHYRPDPFSKDRTRPRFGTLYRLETRLVGMGRTSITFNHRILTVPASQAKRNFNDRSEDAQYSTLDEGDEPERLIASAEGSIVFIQWQKDPKTGRRFFKSTAGVFQDPSLLAPSITNFAIENHPQKRSASEPRPTNAFRLPLILRKSDEDELGHVTNSRYVGLLSDVIHYGLSLGYYANGSGPNKTSQDLAAYPVLPEILPVDDAGASLATTVAVPAGSTFYKNAKVHELYVGYERELKVQPGIYVWSWVEKDRVVVPNHGFDGEDTAFDVIRFEICTKDAKGQEQLLSLCRALVREDGRLKAQL
ncbi:hypothetical protein BGZ73_005881 [Actinomortierella ambigua]|nr:hypothetical protein BGZ73_005881 [Actinomortierella ambigua]